MRVELAGLAARHPAARAGAPPALQPLTLSIAPGEQVAVIGPSGAGKTTLLHALACALKPDAGSLALDGIDPWSLPVRELQKLRGRLFLAPQTPPLPPRQRVITAVLAARLPRQSLWASLRSLLYPDDVGAAHAALMRFDLAPKLWDRVDRLSGGERQRVGLARGLLAPASLWLVDEPLSALDPTRARQAVVKDRRGIGALLLPDQRDVGSLGPRGELLDGGCAVGDGDRVHAGGAQAVDQALAGVQARTLRQGAEIEDDRGVPEQFRSPRHALEHFFAQGVDVKRLDPQRGDADLPEFDFAALFVTHRFARHIRFPWPAGIGQRDAGVLSAMVPEEAGFRKWISRTESCTGPCTA